MQTLRWLLKLGLALLIFGLSILTPKTTRAEVNCYNISDCTYCDIWDGTVYHGYIRKCAV